MCGRSIRLLAAIVVLLVPSLGLADDGTSPVFFSGFPIGASGSYTVTSNLAAVPGCPPIVIIAPGLGGQVDLDLNGFNLDNGACGTPVIQILSPAAKVRIHDGSLSGGSSSIEVPLPAGFPPVQHVDIERVKSLAATGAAIHLGDVISATIRNSEITGAGGGAGILWDGSGAPGGGTIENNVVRVVSAGIIVPAGCSSVAILNNRIEGVAAGCGVVPPVPIGIGIFLAGCAAALVSENTVEEVCSEGISLRSCKTCKLYDNLVWAAGSHGIRLDAATINTLVLNNDSSGNGFPFAGDGLLVEGDGNVIERNVLNSNARWGLHFSGPASIPPNPGLACGNTFGRNTARGNAGPAGPCAGAPALFPPNSCNSPACGAAPNSTYGDNLIAGPPIF